MEICASGPDSETSEWIAKLDGTVRARINVRIRKIAECGSFGDCEPVGEGVYELRFDFGPGYRVYFGIDGLAIILLGGGNKNTQVADIKKSKARWSDYNA